ncbi:MAG: MATE family efflux transporter [Salaquimonas sp.]|jgi:MATE family multidrug resistance protein|nr:MATE family efflux transporter [Salaquimonas sp.]
MNVPMAQRLSLRAHVAATLKLGLPLVGAQIAQLAIQTTDTVMIGWLGTRELAAGVLAGQLLFVSLMLGSGFAFAILPMVAQANGAGNLLAARRSVRMGLWIAAGYTALMMLVLWQCESILLALGQDADIAAMAGEYMRVMQWSLFPALFTFVIRSFLAALEHARIVLVATILAAILNGLVNYALIFGHWGAPALGLQGAGIASVTSASLGFLILCAYALIVPAIRRFEVHVRLWRGDMKALIEVLQLGWPISLTVIAEVGLFASSSVMMGWIGPVQLAAHGISLQIISIIFMIPLGLSTAATIRVGNALGRRDHANLGGIAIATYGIAGAIGLASAVMLTMTPKPLIRLFLDPANPQGAQVVAIGTTLLAVAATFQIVDGMQAVAVGLLRGLKDMRVSMAVAVFSYWVVGMPLAYLLAFRAGFGGVGLWLGLAAGLLLAAIALTARYVWKIARFR